MIDKPNGLIEELLDLLYRGLAKIRNIMRKTFSPIRHLSGEMKRKNPLIHRSILATVVIIICALMAVGFTASKKIYVTIDDSLNTVRTEYEVDCFRADTFIEKYGIDYDEKVDKINVSFYDTLWNGTEIIIQKPFEAYLTVDGQEHRCTTFSLTTAELIKKLRIELGPDDIVTPSLDTVLKKGHKVTVQRVEHAYETELVTVPYTSSSVWTDSVTIGDTQVIQNGSDGTIENTYYVTYIDGEEYGRELRDSQVTKEMVDEVIGYGTHILSGVPGGLSYKQVISGVRAVSYHMGGNPRGVYGMRCEYGTVAVDRNVIPLGSTLYIEGYGYAIANDVGSAIIGNTVDLYMEQYRQCVIWGARTVNVYIIEYGNNSRYWEH